MPLNSLENSTTSLILNIANPHSSIRSPRCSHHNSLLLQNTRFCAGFMSVVCQFSVGLMSVCGSYFLAITNWNKAIYNSSYVGCRLFCNFLIQNIFGNYNKKSRWCHNLWLSKMFPTWHCRIIYVLFNKLFLTIDCEFDQTLLV